MNISTSSSSGETNQRPLPTANRTESLNNTINPLLKYYQEHAGHEAMHMRIALFLVVAIVVSHLSVMYWKARHFKSYQFVTALLLYMLSLVYSINSKSVITELNWIFFTVSIVWVIFLMRYRINNRHTPKLIYRLFSTMHSVATLAAITCAMLYVLLILSVLCGAGPDSKFVHMIDQLFSVILLNTVLFGVLYQDTAGIITGALFSRRGIHLQGQIPTNLPANMCLICGLDLADSKDLTESTDENYTLNCGHTFHNDCIRGWCVIGKKDTCPYCFEKCDLRSRLIQPWEKTELYYGDMLWFVRILLAWNPIIVIAVVYITKWIGWE